MDCVCMHHLAAVAAALAACVSAATAAPADDEPVGDGWLDRLDMELNAGFWLPRLGGDVSRDAPAGAAGNRIDFETEYDLNDLEPSLNLELDIRPPDRRWRVMLSAFDFSTSATDTFAGTAATFGSIAIQPGDRYDASVDFWSIAAEWSVLSPNLIDRLPRVLEGDGSVRDLVSGDDAASNGRVIDLRLAPVLGMRYVGFEHDVQLVDRGVAEHCDGAWLTAYGGASLRIEHTQPPADWPVRDAAFEAMVALGAPIDGSSGYLWQVRAGVSVSINHAVSARFGYRLLELDLDDDDFAVDAGLQGLFLSASIRF